MKAMENGQKSKKIGPGSEKTQFKPGNPGGPGRKPIPEDQREALRQIAKMREEGRYIYAEAFRRLMELSAKELNSLVKKQLGTVVELAVARAILRTIQTGKPNDLRTLRSLMCGAEPKQVEISGPGGEPISPFNNVPTEEIIAVYRQLKRQSQEQQSSCQTNQQQSPASSTSSSPPSEAASQPQDSPTA